MILSDRQIQLIQAVVDTYIQTAEPVSSRLVGDRFFPDLSSATLRNEMSDLEQLGFLIQLHTSGGRVPTDRAYRLCVDTILNEGELEPTHTMKAQVRDALHDVEPDSRSINKAVAHLVSELSDHLAIANTLGREHEDDFFKVGLAGLFESPEFREIDRIFRITDVFEHFDRLFADLEREFMQSPPRQTSQRFRVVIGRENPMRNIQDETVILAQYRLPRRQTGSLTVIGPTRMDYKKNLSLIQCVIDELNNKYDHDQKTHPTRI